MTTELNDIIKKATELKLKSKDLGIKTNTIYSAKAYLKIFHNIKP
jgi:hypothetical protein